MTSNNRPLEKGDLIISKTYGKGTVVYLYGIKIQCQYSDGIVTYQGSYDDIATIRTPVKGTPESRAIVAVLAIEYRAVFRSLASVIRYELRFSYSKNPLESDYGCAYKKAKEKLR